MHNDDNYFQYFAMQYNNGFSAYHASDIISQAYSMNNALIKIKELYKKDTSLVHDVDDGSFNIMIIGHSIGGVIARMSVLLNNHPHTSCMVKNIIQLGTPNIKAPYVPDASLDTLYHSMNKAWEASYLNQSTKNPIPICKYAMKKHNSRYTSDNISNNTTYAYISNDFYCPRCVDSLRVVSITGGEIDLHVHPDLTNIHSIFKNIRNDLLQKEMIEIQKIIELEAKQYSNNNNNTNSSNSAISYIYGLARSSVHCLLNPTTCILNVFSFGRKTCYMMCNINFIN